MVVNSWTNLLHNFSKEAEKERERDAVDTIGDVFSDVGYVWLSFLISNNVHYLDILLLLYMAALSSSLYSIIFQVVFFSFNKICLKMKTAY